MCCPGAALDFAAANTTPRHSHQKIQHIAHITHALQGRIQDFKLGGAHLKKLRRTEGGANNFGVFRVKKHDFTPKNHILSNCGGRREKFWGISCENHDFTPKNLIFSNCGGRREKFWGISCKKSRRFYAKKSYFFQLRREARKILGYFV